MIRIHSKPMVVHLLATAIAFYISLLQGTDVIAFSPSLGNIKNSFISSPIVLRNNIHMNMNINMNMNGNSFEGSNECPLLEVPQTSSLDCK